MISSLGIYVYFHPKFQRDLHQMMGIACIFEGMYIWISVDEFNACAYTENDTVARSILFFMRGYQVYD